jgi:CRP-like cAMP-binding protein
VPSAETRRRGATQDRHRGEYVGELGPLFRMARSATVRARTDAIVTGCIVEAFRRLLENLRRA